MPRLFGDLYVQLSMLSSSIRFAVAIALVPCAIALSGSDPEHDDEVVVTAQKKGELVLIDASFSVPTTPREAWTVLTDFDHMARFVSNLQLSQIVYRSANLLQVSQKGKTSHGLFSFSFESVREIELKPYENIRSRVLSGSMKKLDGTTQLIAEGNGTRIIYHGESIAGIWVPPFVGPVFIENEVRAQFKDIRREILRRRGDGKLE